MSLILPRKGGEMDKIKCALSRSYDGDVNNIYVYIYCEDGEWEDYVIAIHSPDIYSENKLTNVMVYGNDLPETNSLEVA